MGGVTECIVHMYQSVEEPDVLLSGSEQIIQTLKDELKKNKLQNEVAVVKTGCHGLCAEGPVMIVYPEAVFYSRVRPEDVEEIVSEHLLKGRIVERLVYHEAQTPEGIKSLNETTFYKNSTESH